MVLCSKHEPTDITLLENGKLRLNSTCKAYGSRIVIQVHATCVHNSTSKDIYHLCLESTSVVEVETKPLVLSSMNYDAHLSFLSYLGMITSLTLIRLCY